MAIVLAHVLRGLLVFIAATVVLGAPSVRQDSGIVDLGYAVHKAQLDETSGTYRFNDIRYGEAPVGENRFKKPVPIYTIDRQTNNGSLARKCPQAYPEWALVAQAQKLNVSTEGLLQLILNDSSITEDCLVLDVVVPKAVFNQPGVCYSQPEGGHQKASINKVPVIVWIYGGGYDFGYKHDPTNDPSGLLQEAQVNVSDGFIFVAINYRLGLFGWLDGLGDSNIHPNVGLHDQRLALKWVRQYIHLFGGDSAKVTVMGESAGAGSIMHHITAQGGDLKVPFERAIIQSPGWSTTINIAGNWNKTLSIASSIAGRPITNGEELQALESKQLMQINGQVIFASLPGDFTFGPTIDGSYVPDQPGVLLSEGKFDRCPSLLIGHNSHEAYSFVSPEVKTEAAVRIAVELSFVDVKSSTIDYILTEVYPPAGSTTPYHDEHDRLALLFSELVFVCNARYLGTAFNNATWNYRFQVPPAYHGDDLPYTFRTANSTVVDQTLARTMQRYFTAFAMHGRPFDEDARPWPQYGNTAMVQTFGAEGVGTEHDEAANHRCAYWQTGKYRF